MASSKSYEMAYNEDYNYLSLKLTKEELMLQAKYRKLKQMKDILKGDDDLNQKFKMEATSNSISKRPFEPKDVNVTKQIASDQSKAMVNKEQAIELIQQGKIVIGHNPQIKTCFKPSKSYEICQKKINF